MVQWDRFLGKLFRSLLKAGLPLVKNLVKNLVKPLTKTIKCKH